MHRSIIDGITHLEKTVPIDTVRSLSSLSSSRSRARSFLCRKLMRLESKQAASGLDPQPSIVIKLSSKFQPPVERTTTEVPLDPIHHLQLKFITEPEFRKQLFEDSKAALESVGIEASDDVLSILKDLEKDLDKLAAELGVDPKFP